MGLRARGDATASENLTREVLNPYLPVLSFRVILTNGRADPLLTTDAHASVLAAYEGYTTTFQAAYERFATASHAEPGATPDPTQALPFYNTPCMFITPRGVALFPERKDLARHFEQVMLDMRSKRYLRTGLGTPHMTFLGSRCVLLSLEIARFDLDEFQYDEYGVTYTLYRNTEDDWRIAVVTTHPKDAVIHANDRLGS